MNLLHLIRPRFVVLILLWSLPVLLTVVVGAIALYHSGWLIFIAWVLPLSCVVAWVVGKVWPKPKLQKANWQPLEAPQFWTPQDRAAIKVVDDFQLQMAEINRFSIADPNRYIQDAQELTRRLATHFHPAAEENAFRPLTPVEILAVIHLAVEDLEDWMLESVPGSNLATVGQLEQLPKLAKAWEISQQLFFLASSITNPSKLLFYPLWRKSRWLSVALQDELMRAFYQRYLRQLGYYLIEMYSGRLQGGSRCYREKFGRMAQAVHAAGGNTTPFADLQDVNTTIAVMGQVKAGKSSLINALMRDKVAATSILPETREVKCFQYQLPGSGNMLALLDTPGYGEADLTKQQRKETNSAADKADIILLVMAANSPARESDVKLVRELAEHYRGRPQLIPPPIIAVLTHIDLLRPVREWSPPYNWRKPRSAKEQSIAKAVAYNQELFGDAISAYVCVFTGGSDASETSVADEVVPQLVDHLSVGHSAAVLKAFYEQLSAQRFQQLQGQVLGLLKNIGRNLFE